MFRTKVGRRPDESRAINYYLTLPRRDVPASWKLVNCAGPLQGQSSHLVRFIGKLSCGLHGAASSRVI